MWSGGHQTFLCSGAICRSVGGAFRVSGTRACALSLILWRDVRVAGDVSRVGGEGLRWVALASGSCQQAKGAGSRSPHPPVLLEEAGFPEVLVREVGDQRPLLVTPLQETGHRALGPSVHWHATREPTASFGQEREASSAHEIPSLPELGAHSPGGAFRSRST